MLPDESQVFAVAVELFADGGFVGTTFSDIEARLDLPPGTLEGHYGSLDRLWELAVLEAFNRHHDVVYSRCAAVFAGHAREIDRLEQLIAIFIESAGDHPELQRVINQEAHRESHRVDVIFEQAVLPLVDGFQPMIDSLVAAKEIRAVTTREIFFLIANGAASIHALKPLSDRFDQRDGPFDAGEYARSIARIVIGGLRIQARPWPNSGPRPVD